MDLQAPTASSVHEALSILVASINLQNGTEYPTDRLESGALEGLGLSDLGQLAEVVNLAQLTLYNEAATRIAALNKRRNALLPIHQLPVELLIDIFVTFLSHSEKGTWNTLWTLARVTSRWWEIVVHTPRLWVAANILDGPGAVATSLRKSASLPLQILCNDSWSSKDAVRTFIDSVSPHTNRWSKVVFCNQHGRHIIPYLESSTPILEHLELRFTNFATVHLPEDSRLQNLHLHRVSLHWATLRPSNMRFLALHDLRNTITSPIPTPDEMCSILEASPSLEELHLCDWSPYSGEILRRLPQDVSTTLRAPDAAIVLSRLRVLNMQHIPAQMMLPLLLNTRTSVLETLTVDLLDEFTLHPPTVLEALVHPCGGCPLVSTITNSPMEELSIDLASTAVTITDGNPQPRWLNIRLQDANWLSTFGRLLDILPFNNLDTPVRLSLSHIAKLPNHASSAAINLIKSIPSLTHLHCKKYGAVDLDDLIEQLSAPRRASLGHLEWMCPRLRELELFLETHFSGDRSLDPALLSSLSKALRYRRDAAKAAKGGSLLLLPNECKAPEGDLRVTDEFGREYSVESNAFGWRRPTGIALN